MITVKVVSKATLQVTKSRNKTQELAFVYIRMAALAPSCCMSPSPEPMEVAKQQCVPHSACPAPCSSTCTESPLTCTATESRSLLNQGG